MGWLESAEEKRESENVEPVDIVVALVAFALRAPVGKKVEDPGC